MTRNEVHKNPQRVRGSSLMFRRHKVTETKPNFKTKITMPIPIDLVSFVLELEDFLVLKFLTKTPNKSVTIKDAVPVHQG